MEIHFYSHSMDSERWLNVMLRCFMKIQIQITASSNRFNSKWPPIDLSFFPIRLTPPSERKLTHNRLTRTQTHTHTLPLHSNSTPPAANCQTTQKQTATVTSCLILFCCGLIRPNHQHSTHWTSPQYIDSSKRCSWLQEHYAIVRPNRVRPCCEAVE